MKAKTAKKPAKKPVPLEEDERIIAGTLQGARECKMGLAKRFDKVEDAIRLSTRSMTFRLDFAPQFQRNFNV